MGKLIVLEGIDGSGKTTQYEMLCRTLKMKGREFISLEFPQYSEPSSALIRMYLNGEFGTSPEDVNPYAASSFYAVDRYASFKKIWGDYYSSGGLVVSCRYTTSNAIHQASKLERGKRIEFFKWLYEFEFSLMGLPKPDMVIYFSIPAEKAAAQIEKRNMKTDKARIFTSKACHIFSDAMRPRKWRQSSTAGQVDTVRTEKSEVPRIYTE